MDQWNFGGRGPGSARAASLDPDGSYVRTWVPELADVPLAHLHEPWRAPIDVLAGTAYPRRIVADADGARRAHVQAVRAARAAADDADVDDDTGYDLIAVPDGACDPDSDAARTGRCRVYTAPDVRGGRARMSEAAPTRRATKPTRRTPSSPPPATKDRQRQKRQAPRRRRIEGIDRQDSTQRTLDGFVGGLVDRDALTMVGEESETRGADRKQPRRERRRR